MQSDHDRIDHEDDIQLPDDMVQELKKLDKAVSVMSPDADRRVVEAAGAHFGERPRRVRTAGRRWAMAGSVAASLLVGVTFWRMQTPVENLPPAPVARIASVERTADDIDGSGAVDILDAFALARMVREGREPATQAMTDTSSRMARHGRTAALQARIDGLAMSIVALNGAGEKL